MTRHELLRTLVVRDADPPYQLVRPLRAQLCRFDGTDSVLLLTVHHPVPDLWTNSTKAPWRAGSLR